MAAEDFVEALLLLTGRPAFEQHVSNEGDQLRTLSLAEASWADINLHVGNFLAIPSERPPETRSNVQALIHGRVDSTLMALAIEPCSFQFCETVLPPEAFSSQEALRDQVERFRIYSMFYHGSFVGAYRVVGRFDSRSEDFHEKWDKLFGKNAVKLELNMKARPRHMLQEIEGHNLWSLGYLAESLLDEINLNRRKLSGWIDKALEADAKSSMEFGNVVRVVAPDEALLHHTVIRKAAIRTDILLTGVSGPQFQNALRAARNECDQVTAENVSSLRAKGRHNTAIYLTMGDIDVYVATSMRAPTDFTTQARLVESVFNEPRMKEIGIRFFDPTQCFSHDRVDKGLLECLMIMRSQVVLYNAQESDTFGKDSEISYGLACGRHAIVYVARLFTDGEGSEKFEPLYQFLDMHKGQAADKVWSAFGDEFSNIILHPPPGELTITKVIKAIVDAFVTPRLRSLSDSALQDQLRLLGYPTDPPADAQGKVPARAEYVLQRIVALEQRAFAFSEMHPLSLQTSPFDGVARGVIVCRDVDLVRECLLNVLLGKMAYRIRPEDSNPYCYILEDTLSKSPVRVVTRDRVLATAFWSSFHRLHDLSVFPTREQTSGRMGPSEQAL